ncbi:MAG: hypothetical protein HOP96_04920 [Sphingomonas sp.]|nr:hypothetical protein [Sphingomonas sp.]
MADPDLSLIVAVKDGRDNVLPLLAALKARDTSTEIILACAGPPPADLPSDVSAISLPADTLTPSLWSEGIERARGSRVALTTAQFVPDLNWLTRLQFADLDRWVGVGGAIDNDPKASALNWAIFFLRYSAFAPPLVAGETDEIAADNAVYDRAAILEHRDLLAEGFWEPSFHRLFRSAGRKLALDPDLVLVHHGTVTAEAFARQRYEHGGAYGIERAARGGMARNLVLLLSSPLVPPLLLARIISRIARKPAYRGKLITAFPWLVRFTLAWGRGEAGGYASTLGARRRGAIENETRRHA